MRRRLRHLRAYLIESALEALGHPCCGEGPLRHLGDGFCSRCYRLLNWALSAAPRELREVGTDPYFGVRPNRLAPGIKKRGSTDE